MRVELRAQPDALPPGASCRRFGPPASSAGPAARCCPRSGRPVGCGITLRVAGSCAAACGERRRRPSAPYRWPLVRSRRLGRRPPWWALAARVCAGQRCHGALPCHTHAKRRARAGSAVEAAPVASRGGGPYAAVGARPASIAARGGGPAAGRVCLFDWWGRSRGAAAAANQLAAPLGAERDAAARVPERQGLQGLAGALGAHRARRARHGPVLGGLAQGLGGCVPAAALCALGTDRAHGARGDARQPVDRPARQLLAPVHLAPHLLQRLRMDPAAPALAPPVRPTSLPRPLRTSTICGCCCCTATTCASTTCASTTCACTTCTSSTCAPTTCAPAASQVHQRLPARRRLPPLCARAHLERAARVRRAAGGLPLQRGLDLRLEGLPHHPRHVHPAAGPPERRLEPS